MFYNLEGKQHKENLVYDDNQFQNWVVKYEEKKYKASKNELKWRLVISILLCLIALLEFILLKMDVLESELRYFAIKSLPYFGTFGSVSLLQLPLWYFKLKDVRKEANELRGLISDISTNTKLVYIFDDDNVGYIGDKTGKSTFNWKEYSRCATSKDYSILYFGSKSKRIFIPNFSLSTDFNHQLAERIKLAAYMNN